jgi:dihydrofolate reductase
MQCSVFIAASLDGFIARPDGGIDWLSRVERPGEDYGYGKFHGSIDALIVGRKTYEMALGFPSWPYAGKRCVVLTHAPRASKHGEEFYSGPPQNLVARLTGERTRRAYVDGGAVIQQFLAARLITDLTLSIIPVLLGDGMRLFGKTGEDLPLRLVSSRAFDSGLVQLEYHLPGNALA